MATHIPLFHDSLAGQKTLCLSLHHCQESPQLHLEDEATTRWNVKIMLHYTELSLERCGRDVTQTSVGHSSATSALEAVAPGAALRVLVIVG